MLMGLFSHFHKTLQNKDDLINKFSIVLMILFSKITLGIIFGIVVF